MDPTGYDAELRRHHDVLMKAVAVRPGDHVLDIGCGIGRTTREAAHAAGDGSALGVDVSASSVERARESALAEGVRNVSFECADAQVAAFPRGRFDLAISRFGTMFFADPVAAFANIGRALRPGGRLVMMVWQPAERNEWDVAIRAALGGPPSGSRSGSGSRAGAGSRSGSPAFSLGEPPVIERILSAAGFADVRLADVHEPVYYGPDVASALEWVRGFASTAEALGRLDPAAADQALREVLDAHQHDGVWFDSRSWIVSAKT